MKPWQTIDTADAPDGTQLVLLCHDGDYVIQAQRQTLMSSRMHGSEETLARLACEAIPHRAGPRVLIGGLGMGFTLRAALDALPSNAEVVVSELLPAVVAWNDEPLGALAGHPLRDPRVHVQVGDIRRLLHVSRDTFDAVILDVDNGPAAFATSHNASLYGDGGLLATRTALTSGGVLALWSAFDDRRFARRLRTHGFDVRVERVPARSGQRRNRHVVFLATRPSTSPERGGFIREPL